MAGLDDVQAIRIDCKCGASASLNPDMRMIARRACPQCGEQMIADGGTYNLINEFLSAIQAVRLIKSENYSVRLVFKRKEA